jgi:hypothetical protein
MFVLPNGESDNHIYHTYEEAVINSEEFKLNHVEDYETNEDEICEDFLNKLFYEPGLYGFLQESYIH